MPKPKLIENMSVAVPLLSAIMAVGAGGAAMAHYDIMGAMLGVGSGITSALGVWCAVSASRSRDKKLAEAFDMAEFAALAPVAHYRP